jgi:protoporphyrinogen oxidase
MKQTIIVGAGPSGLAAGYYLAKNNRKTILLEKDSLVGGLSKTILYKGCYFDLGGHRFFTEIPEVKALWQEILGNGLLKRARTSRIFYRGKFFNYPLNLSNILLNIGLINSGSCFLSYFASQLVLSQRAESFEDYIVKHFGRRLYKIFFKGYTEKVWGISCSELSCDWAAERIKGLSLIAALTATLGLNGHIRTLIKEFYYPLLGPGMMYEEMAQRIKNAGYPIVMNTEVTKVMHDGRKIVSVIARDRAGQEMEFFGSDFISSMPITELVNKLDPLPPDNILEAAGKLSYRDLLVVNLICTGENIFPDNWIYVHSPEVRVSRIQNYKNWSPAVVPDARKTTLGLEYFCSAKDDFWNKDDKEIADTAARELKYLGFNTIVEDSFVCRVPKAYPVYTIGYGEISGVLKTYLNRFSNLALIGRAGRFKYDNMDGAIASGINAAKGLL